jgi:putative endonuclease
MPYSVYAIYNSLSKKIYIGQTKDLIKRLSLHNSKQFSHGYTARFHGEWQLIYSETAITRNDALQREKQLKSFRGREFIKTHIPTFRRLADQR